MPGLARVHRDRHGLRLATAGRRTDVGAGLNIMVSVQHAPDFLRGPSSGLMPADPSTYQRLMQAMASRYAGKIKAVPLSAMAKRYAAGELAPKIGITQVAAE